MTTISAASCTSRVVALTVLSNGRLAHGRITEAAVRGALILELARAGRLLNERDEVSVARTLVHFDPADDVVTELHDKRGKSLEWHIRYGKNRYRDVLDILIEAGHIKRSRSKLLPMSIRYELSSEMAHLADRSELAKALAGVEMEPDEYVVASLGAILKLVPGEIQPDDVGKYVLKLADTGWAYELVIDFLRQYRAFVVATAVSSRAQR